VRGAAICSGNVWRRWAASGRWFNLLGYGLLAALAAITAGTIPGTDGRTYFDAGLAHPYVGAELGRPNSYIYTPVLTQLIEPLRVLGWDVFRTLWIFGAFGALAYLAGPWFGMLLVVAYFPPLVWEFNVANVNLFIAAAIWAGFRYPAFWAVPVLLKPPLALGLLWFVFRGEWRLLGIALSTTTVIAGISIVLAPGLWADYVDAVPSFVGTAEVLPAVWWPLRLVVAAVLIGWGARRSRHWTVALGAIMAHPLSSVSGWVILLGGVRHYFLRPSRARANGGAADG
jgi:hypothetical protein